MKTFKRLTSFFIVLCMIMSFVPNVTITAFAGTTTWASGGTGTEEDPYIIKNADDMRTLSTNVSGGETYKGKYFKVIAEEEGEEGVITLDSFAPIGDSTSYGFEGTFDGNNTIFKMSLKNECDLALFGYVKNATVRNVITGGDINSTLSGRTAGIAAVMYGGKIVNCHNIAGIASLTQNAAGIVAYVMDLTEQDVKDGVQSQIINCSNSGEVSGSIGAAGICGTIENAKVLNCLNTGIVTLENENTMGFGGITGQTTDSEIINCVNIGSFITDAITEKRVGGIAGDSLTTSLDNCYYTLSYDWLPEIGDAQTKTQYFGISSGELSNSVVIDNLNGYAMNEVTETGKKFWQADGELQLTDNVPDKTYYKVTNNSEKLISVVNYGAANSNIPITPKANMWITNVYAGDSEIFNINTDDISDLQINLTGNVEITALGFEQESENSYIISDANDMKILSDLVNGGFDTTGKTFKVSDDVTGEITLTADDGFNPIGTSENPFKGTFDGNDKTFNITIEKSEVDYIGLFGNVVGGTIKNVKTSGTVNGDNYVGGTVGYLNGGTVINCKNSVAVTGKEGVGGTVGYLNGGTVINCTNGAAVNGNYYVGGTVGYLSFSGKITNCINSGAVTGKDTVGGIGGYIVNGTVTNCVSSGVVTATDTAGIADGIAGKINTEEATVNNCYYLSDVSVTDISDVLNRLNIYVRKNITDDLPLYYWKVDTTTNALLLTSQQQDTPYTITNNSELYAVVKDYANENDSITVTPKAGMMLTGVSVVTESDQKPIDVPYNEDGTFTFTMPAGDVVLTAAGDINFDKDTDGNYLIKTADDMKILSNAVNGGFDTTDKSFKVADIVTEITLTTDDGFEPIGTYDNPFKGTFDGNGKTFNITIDKSSGNNIGLFGYVDGGTIKNVKTSGIVDGDNYVGGTVGCLGDGKIINCTNDAVVTGRNGVGGIAGRGNGYITNCINTAVIETTYSGNTSIGGIVGYACRTITNCINFGEVKTANDAEYPAGGIAGELADNKINLVNSYYDIEVNPTLYNYGVDENKNSCTDNSMGKTRSELTKTELKDNVNLTDLVIDALNIYANENQSEPTLHYWQVNNVSGANILALTKEKQPIPYLITVTSDEEFVGVAKMARNGDTVTVTPQNGNMKVVDIKVTDAENENIDVTTKDDGTFEFTMPESNVSILPKLDINFDTDTDGNYLIKSADDMKTLSNAVNGGIDTTGKTFKVDDSVTEEITLTTDDGFEPIGSTYDNRFKGKFDGNGKTFKLNIVMEESKYVGLFGYVNGGIIKNVKTSGTVKGKEMVGGVVGYLNCGDVTDCINSAEVTGSGGIVGGIVGYVDGVLINNKVNTIKNCTNSGAVTGDNNVGGIAGIVCYVNVTDCTNNGAVTSISTDGGGYVGGTVGYQLEGTVTNCENSGEVTSSRGMVGGIVGHVDDGKVIGCENNGAVVGNSYYVGGIAGYSKDDVMITDCTNNGAVTCDENYAGGIIGYAGDGTKITNCENSGEVTSSRGMVGGIAGEVYGTVTNSISTGYVKGKEYIGGIAGEVYGTLTNCVSFGKTELTEGETQYIGGICGSSKPSTVVNCYYNSDVNSGLTDFGDSKTTDLARTKDELQSYAVIDELNGYANSNSTEELTLLNWIKTETALGFTSEPQPKPYVITNNVSDIAKISGYSRANVEVTVKAKKKNMRLTSVTVMNGETELTVNGNDDGIFTFTMPESDVTITTAAEDIDFSKDTDGNYLIKTANDMKTLSSLVNGGTDTTGKTFKAADSVTEEIILTTEDGFESIGTYDNPFKGTFDGNGKTFKLDIVMEKSIYVGLFGYVECETIKNVKTSGTVKGNWYVGGTAGYVSNGKIINCENSGAVEGNSNYVGGTVGYVYDGTVTNCINSAAVTGNSNYVGGTVGYVYRGTVTGCENSGAVTGSENGVGGIVGFNTYGESIANCKNSGAVTGKYEVGGIAGYASNAVTNCENSGAVTGSGDDVGGIAGYASDDDTIIKNCISSGDVDGKKYVGGVVGYIEESIVLENCISSGAVTGTDTVGGIYGSGYAENVENCYYNSTVNSGLTDFGTSKTTEFARTETELKSYAVLDELNGYVKENSTEKLQLLYWKLNESGFEYTTEIETVLYKITNNDKLIMRTVKYSRENAAVTVKVNQSSGMELTSVAVRATDGTLQTVTDNKDGTFTFTMPAQNVVVSSKSAVKLTQDENGIYLIKSAEDMKALSTLVNNGFDTTGKIFKVDDSVTEEITLAAADGFESIGTYDNPFKGTFDGNGKTFKLNIVMEKSEYVGLFGYVEGGTIKNVKTSGIVTGGRHVGGTAGYVVDGTVTNCENSGAVTCNGNFVGGIVGELCGGDITNCENSGAVTSNDNYGNSVGGTVGYVYDGTVTNCKNSGAVTGERSVGGTVGAVGGGTVTNCKNSGDVTGEESVGGIVGAVGRGTVTDCENSGAVTGDGDYVGGTVGYFSGIVTNCENSGAVVGNSYYVGGTVGYLNGTVANCENSGAVTGEKYVGGTIGYTDYGKVINCLNGGTVTGDGDYVGGTAGYAYYGTVANCLNSGTVTNNNTECGAGAVAGYVYSTDSIGVNYYVSGTADIGIYKIGDIVQTADLENIKAVEKDTIFTAAGLEPLNRYAAENKKVDDIDLLYWQVTTAGEGESEEKVISLTDKRPILAYNIKNNTKYIAIDKESASEGDEIEITVKEHAGYVNIVPMVNGKPISANSEGKYIFTMPGSEAVLTEQTEIVLTKLENDSYAISSLDELKVFAEAVNSGEFKNASATLTADITVSTSDGFVPIGTNDNPYGGYFYGNGHVLTLDISENALDDTEAMTGLFAVTKNAYIYDLVLKGNVNGGNKAESLTSALIAFDLKNSYIYNVYSEADVKGGGYVGGIVGVTSGEDDTSKTYLTNAVNNGTVTQADTAENAKKVGTIIGMGYGEYSNVYANTDKNKGIYDYGYYGENAAVSNSSDLNGLSESKLFADEVMDELNSKSYSQDYCYWNFIADGETKTAVLQEESPVKYCLISTKNAQTDNLISSMTGFVRVGKTAAVQLKKLSDNQMIIDGITVTDTKGNEIETVKTGELEYEFTAPEKNVTVEVLTSYDMFRGEDGEYYISNADDFQKFAQMINSGRTDINAKVMTKKLDLTDLDEVYAGNTKSNAYGGVFDGNGAEIIVNKHMFKYTDGAAVKNMNVKYTVTDDYYYFYGLVYNAADTVIDNCSVNISSEDIEDIGELGGIAGYMQGGMIVNCSVTANVDADVYCFGGIVDDMEGGMIANCILTADTNVYAGYAGGIAEWVYSGKIYNCVNEGNITAAQYKGDVGGIAGIAVLSELDLKNNFYIDNNYVADVGYDYDTDSYLNVPTDENSAVSVEKSKGKYISAMLNKFVEANPDIAEGTELKKWSYDIDSEGTHTRFANEYDKDLYLINRNGIEITVISEDNLNVFAEEADKEISIKLPDEATVNVTDNDGNAVEISEDNKFIMPNSDVTISASMDSGIEETIDIDGTTYVKVTNADDFIKAVSSMANGNTALNVYLAEDIELTEEYMQKYPNVTEAEKQYNGIFDGGNHTVTFNYTADNAPEMAAMLPCIGKNGVVKNVITDGTILAKGYMATGIALKNYGIVMNCINKANIADASYSSGFVGYNSGTVIDCINKGDITGISSASAFMYGNYENALYLLNEGTISAGDTNQTLISEDKGYVNGCEDLKGVSAENKKKTAAYTNNGICEEETGNYGIKGFAEITVKETDSGASVEFADEENMPYYVFTNNKDKETYHKVGETVEAVFDLSEIDADCTIETIALMGKFTDSETAMTQSEGKNNVYTFTMPSESCYAQVKTTITGIETDENGYYLVGTLDELLKVKSVMESGDYGVNIKLTADIEGYADAPITAYDGIFDGDGHSITVNILDTANKTYSGFFRKLNEDAVVKGLTIKGTITSNSEYMAAVAGRNKGEITDCKNYASLISFNDSCEYISGIAAYVSGNKAAVKNCENNGEISGKYSGGITVYGKDGAVVENCVNNGAVSGSETAGGIIVYSEGSTVVENCENNGAVSGSGTAGGITAYSEESAVVKNCENNGEISGKYSGGITAYREDSAAVESCENNGEISGKYSGGIIAYSEDSAVVKNCENNGTVNGERCTGGIVGYGEDVKVINGENNADIFGEESSRSCSGGIVGGGKNIEAVNCINRGDISGGENTAGIIGAAEGLIQVRNCYTEGNITGGTIIANVQEEIYLTSLGEEETEEPIKTHMIKNSYYLQTEIVNNGLETSNIADKLDKSEAVTQEEIASGYVSGMLNSGVSGEMKKWTIENGKVIFGEGDDGYYYGIIIDKNIEGGTVTADKLTAKAGDTVTLTITPETAGKTVIVTGVELDENNSFVMPERTVRISAIVGDGFKASEKEDVIHLSENVKADDIVLADYVEFENDEITRDFEFALADGSTLPDGMTFTYGRITGTPTKAGEYTVVFDVTDSGATLASLDEETAIGEAQLTLTIDVAKTYKVTVNTAENGIVTADKEYAKVGETVKLTVRPNNGYAVDTITGADVENNTFEMPEKDVEISAVFVPTFESGEKTDTIKLVQNYEMEKVNLADYVKFTDENVTKVFAFALADGSTLPEGLTLEKGIISGTPKVSGKHEVKFSVKTSAAELMSLTPEFATETAELTLTFDIEATYKVNIGKTKNGSVTADKEYAKAGETVTLKIVPSENYEMIKLEGVVPDENGGFMMPAQAVEINAVFGPKFAYTEKADTIELVQNYAMDSVNLGDYFKLDDENAVLTFTLADGSTLPSGVTFKDGAVSGTPTKAGVYTVVFNIAERSETALKVTFNVKATYKVNIAETKNGSVTADKVYAKPGETIKVTVKADSGYVLDKITGVILDENSEFVMPSNDVTVTAGFISEEAADKVGTYNITVSTAENGTVTADKAYAKPGETVKITATPKDGYVLDKITGVILDENSEFVMPSRDVTVTASFISKEAADKVGAYNITVGTVENGSVTADKAYAKPGETVKVTATPKDGYVLDKITGVIADENGEFVMPSRNVTIGALFVSEDTQKAYTITVKASENGSVAANKQTAKKGETVVLAVTPKKGYVLTKINGVDVSVNNTFVMPARDVTIEAVFEPTFESSGKADTIELVQNYAMDKVNLADYVKFTDENVSKVFAFALADGSTLPEGLTLETGIISGTPKVSGKYEVKFSVTASAAELMSLTPEFAVETAELTLTFDIEATYKVNIAEIKNGSVTADKEYAKAGETVKLTVKAADGYVVSEFVGAAVVNNEFVMPANDVTIEAVFVSEDDMDKEYKITIETSGNGTVTAKSTAKPGETVALTVTPKKGYVLTKIEGVEATSNNTFVMPARDVTVKAVFEPTFESSGKADTIELVQNYAMDKVNLADYVKFTDENVSKVFAFALADGSTLPEGLTLETGIISGTPKVSGKYEVKFSVTASAAELMSLTPEFAVETAELTLTFDIEATYKVNIAEIKNGSVTADKEYAKAGETVALTVKAADGYTFVGITGVNADSENTFVMPSHAVTVGAMFKGENEEITETVIVGEKKENGDCIVKYFVPNGVEYCLICVKYSTDGVITGMEIIPSSEDTNNGELTVKSGENTKIMLWKGLSSMQPLCRAYEVK